LHRRKTSIAAKMVLLRPLFAPAQLPHRWLVTLTTEASPANQLTNQLTNQLSLLPGHQVGVRRLLVGLMRRLALGSALVTPAM